MVKAAAPQDLMALPDALRGVPGAVRVAPDGDDLAAEGAVEPQDLLAGERTAAVPDPGAVDLQALPLLNDGAQQALDLAAEA